MDNQRAVDFTETIVELFLTSLRASDSVGRIAERELGIVLLGARRLDAFDVLREIGRVAEREDLLDPDVRVHLGIAEIDPAYGGAPVLDLLDVARRDLQMPPVEWSEPRGGALGGRVPLRSPDPRSRDLRRCGEWPEERTREASSHSGHLP